MIEAIPSLHPWSRRLLRAVTALSVCLLAACAPQEEPQAAPPPKAPVEAWDDYEPKPKIAPASEEAARLMRRFRMPPGFEVSLFAAEPMLANPVAFSVDGEGRFLVAETFRQADYGVPDNRSFPEWLGDDIAARSVEDRRAYYTKHHPELVEQWTSQQDRLRLVEDTTGNGQANRSVVFAGGFDDLMDGTGAGVLRVGRDVFYTCIPHLWKLTDADGDDRAEQRVSVAAGFGVRTALRGHDCHGLVMGPDGRLYFSIGDRGYNLPDYGYVSPGSGAVFRCEPDGSHLEVFATGLRNPQELAFDAHGNLITGDNNSDSDDEARIVWVTEGAEIGWRMSFQSLSKRGPWVREGWWKPHHEGQAAFLLPPIANLGNGPSGLVYNPGTGFPKEYDDCFFLADFVGSRSAKSGGVRAFRLEVEGGGFRLAHEEMFLRGSLPTDCDFGWDGAFYVSDWGHGWVGEGKGRLYRIIHESAQASAEGVASLLGTDFTALRTAYLASLLEHRDRRVRQQAQFALASRGRRAEAVLLRAAKTGAELTTRLHGIWGLGQIGRRERDVMRTLLPLAKDRATEVRAQVAKVLGDAPLPEAENSLLMLLRDASHRVRVFAAIALGNLARDTGQVHGDVVGALWDLARENADADPWVRHGAVVGLARHFGHAPWRAGAGLTDRSASVRLATVLALRRLADERIVTLDAPHRDGQLLVHESLADRLHDDERAVRQAAARAIYDVPIPSLMSLLAARLPDVARDDLPMLTRCVGANDLGTDAASARRLAEAAADGELPRRVRLLALRSLQKWAEPPARDLIVNEHRPRAVRNGDDAQRALAAVAEELLKAPNNLLRPVVWALGSCGVGGHDETLAGFVRDEKRPVIIRVAALEALTGMESAQLEEVVEQALTDGDGRLRGAAAKALVVVDPKKAVAVVERALERGNVVESQLGFATLAKLPGETRAGQVLRTWVSRLVAGTVPKPLMLDVLDAAERRGEQDAGLGLAIREYLASLPPRTEVGAFLDCLEGGDAGAGRKVFHGTVASCRRCHGISGRDELLAGPDLSGVGLRRTREEILHSILDPNAVIVEGFENEMVETDEGDLYDGRVLKETDEELLMEIDETGTPERITIPKDAVVFRKKGKSGMPPDASSKLSRRELRDLVAFLTTLRKEEKKEPEGGHGK